MENLTFFPQSIQQIIINIIIIGPAVACYHLLSWYWCGDVLRMHGAWSAVFDL